MAIIWFFMMTISIFLLIFKNPLIIISQILNASANGVSLCINLCGIYCVWLGLINILDKSGLSEKIANLLKPIIKFLFRTKNKQSTKYIAINLSSNLLGLGNAATPSGIKAMQELDDNSGKITFSGIMLLVINCLSIQLIPTTVIGLRESAGSTSSTDILLPTILSSFVTLLFGICLVFACNKVFGRRKK